MKAQQLRSKVKTSSHLSQFLVKIKTTIDDLALVATYCEHMDSILERLPKDFDSIIALIESRLTYTCIEEV